MRLTPRSADVAALAVLGRGRCFWPECDVKIYEPVDGQYVANCDRAHIEAAEENGPRWNRNSTDEERRAPANLMWLCVKHHKTVDRNPAKYSVAVLSKWKADREQVDPDQRVIDGLTEQRLEEVINEAMERLVDRLEDSTYPAST